MIRPEPWSCEVLDFGEVLRGYRVDLFLGKGGFGAVYRAMALEESTTPRCVAVKIFSGDVDRDVDRGADRIRQEAKILKMLNGEGAPRFVTSGTVRRRPFVMMELLESLHPDDGGLPETPREIEKFASDVLDALRILHGKGWIHCDLKPENVVRRPADGRYLLIDFGAAHRLETEEEHIPVEGSVNLRSGEYMRVGTYGYMPPDRGYLRARDIYAFGHLLRDCFPMEVPLEWMQIIGKCISNNPRYRYPNIQAVMEDVRHLRELGREEMELRIRRWRTQRVQEQRELIEAKSDQMTALSLGRILSARRGVDPAFYVGEAECLIDFPALDKTSLRLTTPLFLKQEKLLVVKGPGVLRCDLSCDPREAHTILLMDRATLINTSRLPPDQSRMTYCVGEHCYVNLKGLPPNHPLPDGTYWLSSSGNAFIRRGGPDCVADILSDVDVPLWNDRRPTQDESLKRGPYVNRPGLTTHLCEQGTFFAAMGVEKRSLRERLNEAFGRPDWCPARGGCRRIPCLGAILGNVSASRFGHSDFKSKHFELLAPDCRMMADGNMTLAIAAALEASSQDRGMLSCYTVRALQIFGRICHDEFGGLFQKWIFSRNPRPYGSWGNGAAMRVSPCAWAAVSLDEALEFARVVTAVTHDHPEGIKGAEAVTAAIFLARKGESMAAIRAYVMENYYPQLTFTLDEIRPDYVHDTSCSGSVPHALQAFFESTSFEDAIRNAVSLGGDSDTLAAIAGSVAEAYYGIPVELERRFLKGRYIDEERLAILRGFTIGR